MNTNKSLFINPYSSRIKNINKELEKLRNSIKELELAINYYEHIKYTKNSIFFKKNTYSNKKNKLSENKYFKFNLKRELEKLASLRDKYSMIEWDLVDVQIIEDKVKNYLADEIEKFNELTSLLADEINPNFTQSIERSRSKLDKKIKEKIKYLETKFKVIIIDGNNLCHDNNGNFIGLKALSHLIPILVDNHPQSDIILFFDPSIKKTYQLYDIHKEIDSMGVEIKILNEKADETIVKLAKNYDHYVISNDNFIDFPKESRDLEGKLLNHYISKNQIIINRLDIEIYWR